jgi:hypothetical protein
MVLFINNANPRLFPKVILENVSGFHLQLQFHERDPASWSTLANSMLAASAQSNE